MEVRHRLEAAALGGLLGSVGRLPPSLAPWLGRVLGGLAFRLDGKRRRRALRNLEHAFGSHLSAVERRALVASYYRHLGRALLENVAILRQRPRRPFSDYLQLDQFERALTAIGEHGAVIFVTCHSGPWELLGATIAERTAKSVHGLYLPLVNPYLDQRLAAMRETLGLATIRADDRRAVASMLRLLERGESIGILCDLNHRQNPLFVDFFGRPAATVRLPGLLAVRSGKPIVPTYAWYTEEPYRYRATFERPLLADVGAETEGEVARIVQAVVASNERFIRQHPDQWHWNYNRWKTRPIQRESGIER